MAWHFRLFPRHFLARAKEFHCHLRPELAMAVRLHFLAAADSVFSRREKETRKTVFALGQEMETDFLRALADCFVASIAEVGSSLEIYRSCFVDLGRCSIGFVIAALAIAAADPFVVADPGSDSVVAVDLSVIAAGFVGADYFRSAPDLNLAFSCPSVAAAVADVFHWDVS